MLRCALAILIAATMYAQTPRSKADLLSLTDELQVAVKSGDWRKAAELSALLKSETTIHRNRAFSGGANEQIDAILAWLPDDTETAIVAAEPFLLPAADSDSTRHPRSVSRLHSGDFGSSG